jgi:hypothetical protein
MLPRLLPRLCGAASVERARDLARAAGRDGPAYGRLSEGLCATLVLDSGRVMRSVSWRLLSSWRISFDAALERAIANLITDSDDAFLPMQRGLWIGPWEDGFASSRALLWPRLQSLATDPIVAVPDTHVLLVADPRDRQAMAALIEAVALSADIGRHPLSKRLYRLFGARLEPVPAAELGC